MNACATTDTSKEAIKCKTKSKRVEYSPVMSADYYIMIRHVAEYVLVLHLQM